VIGLAVSVAIATFLIGLAGAALVGRLPSLRGRIAGLAMVASLVPLVGVLGSGIVMFESSHDTALVLLAAAASTAALAGALLLARSIVRPVVALGDQAAAMGAGDLSTRAATDGPTELAELARAFNHMAADVEALFDTRRELAAWASHDLRTPLTALQAMIEASEDEIVAPGHYLPQMRDQVRALTTMVDDLHQMTLLDAGVLVVRPEPVRLDLTVPATVEAFQAAATGRGLTLASQVPDRPATAACAEELVERVLANLLENAMRHTPAGGRIDVSVTAADCVVAVAVSDDGPGIAGADLDRVFEPFFRGDRARRDGGSGLGLAIARGLVEAQGGRIAAHRRPEGGTTVGFTLPASEPPGVEPG
jgi:two-component system sensor histidine kinase BaeS